MEPGLSSREIPKDFTGDRPSCAASNYHQPSPGPSPILIVDALSQILYNFTSCGVRLTWKLEEFVMNKWSLYAFGL